MSKTTFRLTCKSLLVTYEAYLDEGSLKEMFESRRELDGWHFAYHVHDDINDCNHTHVLVDFKKRIDWTNKHCLDYDGLTPIIKPLTSSLLRTEALAHLRRDKLKSSYTLEELEKDVAIHEIISKKEKMVKREDKIKKLCYLQIKERKDIDMGTFRLNEIPKSNKDTTTNHIVWISGNVNYIISCIMIFLDEVGLTSEDIGDYVSMIDDFKTYTTHRNFPIYIIKNVNENTNLNSLSSFCGDRICFIVSSCDIYDINPCINFLENRKVWVLSTKSESQIRCLIMHKSDLKKHKYLKKISR